MSAMQELQAQLAEKHAGGRCGQSSLQHCCFQDAAMPVFCFVQFCMNNLGYFYQQKGYITKAEATEWQ